MGMKRTLLVLGMVLALAMTAMASADVVDPDPGITSPTAGEVIYENTLELRASEPAADEDVEVAWAVRSAVNNPTCGTSQDDLAGWRGPQADAASWADGDFSADIDVSTWDAGEYCFAFNPHPYGEFRDTVFFYIVDEYAKVGGNVDNADYLIDNFSIDLKELRGRQLSHAFEGVVGNAGSEGTVGSITVNYRQLDEYVTFYADNLKLSAAAGVDVTDDEAKAEITAGDTQIIALDKDAAPNPEKLVAPRGAMALRYAGTPTKSVYEIDLTPGSGGFESWVPLVNGNVEVGIR